MANMGMTKKERASLPPGEPPLLRYQKLLDLRQPLEFHQVAGKNEYLEGNEVHSPSWNGPDWAPNVAALGKHVMRTGKHYATFKQVGDILMFGGSMVSVGIIRPVDLSKKRMKEFLPWDKKHYPGMADANRTAGWGGKVDYAVYNTNGGACFFGYWDNPSPKEKEETNWWWSGREHTPWNQECGLLLDLDAGTLAVYKNGRRLGVLVDG